MNINKLKNILIIGAIDVDIVVVDINVSLPVATPLSKAPESNIVVPFDINAMLNLR